MLNYIFFLFSTSLSNLEKPSKNAFEIAQFHCKYVGVSKNTGTPKWMVYNGNPIKIHDLGVPLYYHFFGNTHVFRCRELKVHLKLSGRLIRDESRLGG